MTRSPWSPAKCRQKERAAAERSVTELRAERATLLQKTEGTDAGRRALAAKIHAATAEAVAAGKMLIRENLRLAEALAPEFARDIGRLPLPELFAKRVGIDSPFPPAFAHLGAFGTAFQHLIGLRGDDGRFCGLQIASLVGAEAVLFRGQYRDPDRGGEVIDWGGLWRGDPASVALNQQLAGIGDALRRAKRLIAREEEVQRARAEAERRLDQQRRQSEYYPVPVSRTFAPNPGPPAPPPRPYQPDIYR
jgi:hypothetical protein